jgi:formylglycine-generating enzyme required for sulfatase activity
MATIDVPRRTQPPNGVSNPTSSQSESLVLNNELLLFLQYTRDKYNVVYLYNNRALNTSLFDVYIPSPTNCSLDITVTNGNIARITENTKRVDGTIVSSVDYSNEQISLFSEKLRYYILNGIEYNYPNHSDRPLITKATWSDGFKENYWTLNAFDIVSIYDSVVILGKPGTGKSTSLRYLAVNLIENLLKDNSIDNNIQVMSRSLFDLKYVPIYIEFRRFAEWWSDNDCGNNLTIDLLEKYIISVIESDKSSFFDFSLKYVFIFDGIDEIPIENDRVSAAFGVNSINQFVTMLKRQFKNPKLLFSSRFGEYSNYRLRGFKEVEFVQLTKYNAIELIKNIFYVSGQAGECNAEKLISDMQEKGFKEDVIFNPMLLSLITSVAVEKGENSSLPNNKTEVLREGIDLLLDRWAVKDEDKPAFFQQFESREMKEAIFQQLEQFAYNQNENGTISNEALLNLFMGHGIVSDNARDILDYLSSKVGLIVAEGGLSFKFAHRSFRAYLAAAYIVGQKQKIYDLILSDIDNKLVANHETTFLAIDLLFDSIAEEESNIYVLENIVHRLLVPKAAKSEWCIWFAAKIISNRNYLLYNRLKDEESYDLTVLRENLKSVFRKSQSLPIEKRIECGVILGFIGDDRYGVGISEDNLPEIKWCAIPSGQFDFGIDLESIDKIRTAPWGKVDFTREKRSDGETINIRINSFEISKYPVTIKQFGTFIQAEDGYLNPRWYSWSPAAAVYYNERIQVGGDFFGFPIPKKYQVPNYPATFISFFDAVAFCQWLTAKNNDGFTIRLPSEMEREYVVKLGGSRIFEWGDDCVNPDWSNDYIADNCNALVTGIGTICPVGAFNDRDDDSPIDLTGNTWEWTQSYFTDSLDAIRDNRIINTISNPNWTYDRAGAILITNRSGCMYNGVNCLRLTFRGRDPVLSEANDRHSFRVIRTKEEPLYYNELDFDNVGNHVGIAEGYGVPVKQGDRVQIMYYIYRNGNLVQSNLNYSFVLGDGTIHSIFERELLKDHRVACNIRMKLKGLDLFGRNGFFEIISPDDELDILIHLKDVSED